MLLHRGKSNHFNLSMQAFSLFLHSPCEKQAMGIKKTERHRPQKTKNTGKNDYLCGTKKTDNCHIFIL